MNIKEIIAANIASLRTANHMTQLALAEKLCYSDKAISKWERGESIPDIAVLKQIADLFCVTVDYIITDHTKDPAPPPISKNEELKIKRSNRIIITLLSLTGVWFLGLLAFVLIWIISRRVEPVIFICCLPACALITLIFGSIWEIPGRKRISNYLSITLLIWSALLIVFVLTGGASWQYFLLGIPPQIALTLAILIRFKRKNK